MEKTQSAGAGGDLGNDIEASILSAHKKFFEGNAEARKRPGNAEAMLYDAVLSYFNRIS